MDPGVRDELVELTEAEDVADLGDERGADRGPDPRDRLEAPGERTVEQSRDALLGGGDLLPQEIVLRDEQLHLEPDLSAELRRGDGVFGQGLNLLGLRGPDRAVR